jgi:hypothetical protein
MVHLNEQKVKSRGDCVLLVLCASTGLCHEPVGIWTPNDISFEKFGTRFLLF